MPYLTSSVVFFVFSLLLSGISAASSTIKAPMNASLTASIDLGLTWFSSQEFRRRDTVAFSHWIADLVNSSHPTHAKILREKGQALYAERQDDYLLRNLIGGKKDFPMDMPMIHRYRIMLKMKLQNGELGNSAGGTEDFLGLALYAGDPNIREGFESIYHAMLTLELDRYGSTHQLLALILLRNTQFLPQANVDGAIKRVSDGIARELPGRIKQAIFTDLIAEELALLCMAGQTHLISPTWIEFIIKHQQEDGSWRQAKTESNAQMLDMDQHASMLTLYALLKYQEAYPGIE
jgi:hypothetical protein